MSNKFKDITGQTFNRLFVICKTTPNKWNKARWKCKCSCGNFIDVDGESLKSKNTQSCGCLNRERSHEANHKHGLCGTPEYTSWCQMISRCHCPTAKYFFNYGGRGIEVFPEWREDFMSFYNHIGARPTVKHTIERIDNNAGYFPGNVRWATRREQANNTRRNQFITANGETHTIAQWARITGICAGTIYSRIRLGWNPVKAVI